MDIYVLHMIQFEELSKEIFEKHKNNHKYFKVNAHAHARKHAHRRTRSAESDSVKSIQNV